MIIKKEIIKKIIQIPKNIMIGFKNSVFLAIKKPLNPKWIVFMMTDMCNSRCIHCNIWQLKSTEPPLTPKEIQRIFSDKLFKNVEYILCTGGEATLRNDLEEVLLSFHKVLPKATLQISTNALLPEKVINITNFAIKHNINFEVGISIDGIGQVHDKIRGIPGNFKKADWLIHELIKIRDKHKGKLKIAAGIVVSDFTVDSIYQVRGYVEKLNIDYVEAWYNISSFYSNDGDKEKTKLKNKIEKIVKSQPKSLLKEKWIKHLDGKSIKFPCFAVNTFFVVKANGDIVPCLTFWNSSIGNIRRHPPQEIWHSTQAKKIREKVKNCQGCLNSWGFWWSTQSNYYQILFFHIKHPLALIKKLFS